MTDDNQDTISGLGSHLFRIPEGELLALVADLEKRSLDRSKAAAVAAVMDQLRPRLAILKPARQTTLVRFFAEPFADLLYTPGEPRKAIGRIPRSAIVPCWNLLTRDADAKRMARFASDITEADPENPNALKIVGEGFWRYAASVLRQAIERAESSPSRMKETVADLGDAVFYAALIEIVGVLEVAGPIMELRAALPTGNLAWISNQQLEAICAALNAVHRQRPANTSFVVYVILSRLANPSLIVDILERAAEAGAAADLSVVSRIANEAIVSQTEEKIRGLEERIDSAIDQESLALQAERFVAEILGAAKAVNSSGSRNQTRQVDRVRTQMADIVRRRMLEALDPKTDEMMALLSSQAKPAEKSAARAALEDRVVSLRIASRYADELGLERDVNRRLAALEQSLDRQASDLLAQIRSRAYRTTTPEHAERDLMGTVRMIELLLGPERADRVRRQGETLLRGE